MAYPLAHLLVADLYAAKLPALYASGGYYLGAIAPDAIHMRAGAGVLEKETTHLHTRGGDALKRVMAYFYAVGRTPFDIGYGVHVLTDRLWVRYYRGRHPSLLDANGRTREDLYRADAVWIDRALYAAESSHQRFLPLLEEAGGPDAHPFLARADIEGWRDTVLCRLRSEPEMPAGEPLHLTLRGVQDFLAACAEEIKTLLP